MKRTFWIAAVLVVAGFAGIIRAQSPAPVGTSYQFPFWSDGDVDSGDKPFHIGYRTGFVISNPNADPLTVEITFYGSEGRTTNVVMSDGAGAIRLVPPRATVNLTTPAEWRSPQRFGYVTVSGNLQFFMTVQVELVHIQNPAVPSTTAVDPRVSVMRMEAAKSSAEVLISWERSTTTDTGFVFANTTGQTVSVTVHAFGGSKQVQTVGDVFLGPNGTVIRTIQDFDGFPSLLSPDLTRNHGYIKTESPAGVIMVGVVFRTVQDPILLPAAMAIP